MVTPSSSETQNAQVLQQELKRVRAEMQEVETLYEDLKEHLNIKSLEDMHSSQLQDLRQEVLEANENAKRTVERHPKLRRALSSQR